MTVPVPCPPSDVPSSTPRKRRRRAPASGASDDCFACIKRNTKCDRRRPYCSQCLEVGNECSGYKTQLTWGVGVASRGKLRGLSLPVAKSAPAAKSPIMKHTRSATSIHKHTDSRDLARSLDRCSAKIKLEGQSPLPSNGYTTYDFINMVPNSPSSVQSQSITADWTIPIPQEYMRSPPTSAPDQQNHQQILRQSLQRLHTPFIGHADEMNMGSPSGSMSTYSDTDYSPLDHSFSADDVPFLASPMPMYHSYSGSPVDHSAPFNMMQEGRGPTSCPDQYYAQSEVSSSLSSHPTVFEMGENRRHAGSPHRSEVNYDDEISSRFARRSYMGFC
jgi:Fungal Zn(2)-Cys(6) binuclear cluster domain